MATANSVHSTADGRYIVAGGASGEVNGCDAWALRLDADGTILWQKTYGGAEYEVADSAQPSSDGGYIVAGSTRSFSAGGWNAWVLMLDATGNVSWQEISEGRN